MKNVVIWLLFFCLLNPLFGLDEEVLFKQHRVHYLTQLRYYTYLYAAQCQTTVASVKNCIKEQLLQHFFPDFVTSIDNESQPDADNILCPLFARMQAEESSDHVYTPCCWQENISEHIMQTAKWIPFSAVLPFPPPPLRADDRKGWEEQFKTLYALRNALTPKQRKTIAAHERENWLVLAHNEIKELKEEEALLILSLLTKSLYDGMIVEMRAKYTYCVPRPFMQDPHFEPLIHRLSTPSYPSGHAIQGSIYQCIFNYFFPEDHKKWETIRDQAKLIRMQEGVHFPEDVEAGSLLGHQIAQQIIRQSEECFHLINAHLIDFISK